MWLERLHRKLHVNPLNGGPVVNKEHFGHHALIFRPNLQATVKSVSQSYSLSSTYIFQFASAKFLLSKDDHAVKFSNGLDSDLRRVLPLLLHFLLHQFQLVLPLSVLRLVGPASSGIQNITNLNFDGHYFCLLICNRKNIFQEVQKQISLNCKYSIQIKFQ